MKKTYLFACCIASAVAFTNCAKQDKGKPAFDTSNMDLTVKPGDDFNAYANGGWIKNPKMPDDKSRYGAFDILREENDLLVKQIFEKAYQKTDAPKGSSWQKVGDFFASGMDTINIEKQGYEPIKGELKRIADIQSTEDLQKEIIALHQQYYRPNAMRQTTEAIADQLREFQKAEKQKDHSLRMALQNPAERVKMASPRGLEPLLPP